ncbi:putative membrane-bound dehydrogenase domain-containing protein [Catalinimonas alkaloidigena]|uniref:Putative membrane-bound dehydrogenase domain-containing protein n=1 Tax=Catalinimonas alkaloidigena TaxID=1075417 RepID=A0A1G9APZ7_9BACT|nr:PVC-type heme-binding CxxCH protein [Catalinimonas alkaloidigena]SDK29388.1 putative membrane-bound dehydrogenase domain-containing protein [Catalinimonas alkaloidigena]
MNSPLSGGLSFLCAASVLASCAQHTSSTTAQTSEPNRDSLYAQLSDAEKRDPQWALLGLETAEDLNISLFASEPMLVNPTNIDIDAEGRVWVCEAYNYRMQLNPNNPTRDEGDRIVILEDRNGDGKADTSQVFYQGPEINAALGIAVLGNEVIVSCSPNVFKFTDTDGDRKADKKEVLFTGLGGEQHDHAIHAFTFGPDGKLYFNFGNEGGQLRRGDGSVVKDIWGRVVDNTGAPFRQGMVFRCNPDGSDVEVLGHNFRNNYEVAVDAFGTLWQSDNDDDGNQGVRINYVMEHGNFGYTDELTGAGWRTRRTNMEAEIPKRHWHLNDPGVVPNLLQTGAGSPTGMVIYEGSLLPERFQYGMIHADAGPNVVRAYPTEPDGAGYQARIENLVQGARDQWFRPSDVCVAPDGSLFIADWYDPGVGGHQMGDLAEGRIYRITPKQGGDTAAYHITPPDLSTPAGAAEALKSPNLATRTLAWKKLYAWGADAEPALQTLWQDANPRFRARALWLLSKLPQKGETYLQQALSDENPDLRITGLRAARQVHASPLPYVKQLVNDPSPQVRREAALALYHQKAPEAAQLWADLAAQHDGKDRWYLEALGIAADGQWDRFFTAWKNQVGNEWNTPAGRDLVWRARTEAAVPLIVALATDPATSSDESPRYFRALDFQQGPATRKALLASLQNPASDAVTLLTLQHLDPQAATLPQVRSSLQKMLEKTQGTYDYLTLVERYRLKDQYEGLLQTALSYPDSSLGADAVRILVATGGIAQLRTSLASMDEATQLAAVKVMGKRNEAPVKDILRRVMLDTTYALSVRQEAVRGFGSGWDGEEQLVALVRERQLPEELKPTAAGVLVSAYRQSIRNVATEYLNVASEGSDDDLPPVVELAKLEGNATNGKQVFQRICQACHQVDGQGIDFGPKLSEIGSKLSREAQFVSILHPDAGISFGYEGFVVKLKNGSTVTGMITSQTENEIAMKLPGGTVNTYPLNEVVSKTPLDHSLMPTGLQRGMTQEELVDLVEYLMSLKRNS